MVDNKMKIIEYYKKRKQKKAEKRQKRSRFNKILRTTVETILYLAFIVLLVWGTPKALSHYLKTDYPMAAITSGSMWPELKRGDLIFVQGIAEPKNEIKVGDIVVFMNEKNAFTIHRVIELRADTLVTKGDANNVSDEPVKYSDVIGKLYRLGNWNARIPKLGFISTTFSQYVQK